MLYEFNIDTLPQFSVKLAELLDGPHRLLMNCSLRLKSSRLEATAFPSCEADNEEHKKVSSLRLTLLIVQRLQSGIPQQGHLFPARWHKSCLSERHEVFDLSASEW